MAADRLVEVQKKVAKSERAAQGARRRFTYGLLERVGMLMKEAVL